MRLNETPLLVFSHLRWNFVHQRPQHLMSRFAERRPVFFVEEPLHEAGAQGHWNIVEVAENLTVCQPVTSVEGDGFHDLQVPVMQTLVSNLIEERINGSYATWFYTPMALPLLAGLRPKCVIYDCMDALALFLHAPPQIRAREQELVSRADLMFVGGPSLYRAHEGKHANLHCFPSSVDAAHFAQALNKDLGDDLQRDIPRPRLGYIGVIDERIDLALLDSVAFHRPEWQLVMVGPVVKIDPASLPRRPNIHYFGQQSYESLPQFLAGWDVCLLPFARNQSTKFISPTKTLEYMAAGKPIVSTPIVDVVDLYDDIVYIAGEPNAFINACEEALNSTPEEKAKRQAGVHRVLAATSWDQTAAAMEDLLEATLQKSSTVNGKGNLHPQEAPFTRTQVNNTTTSETLSTPVAIVGAGPTGLSAAYHLGQDALLFERENRVGGWCRSISLEGFTFDFAGHIMFSNDPYVHHLYEVLLGDNVIWQDREAWIYSHNVYTRYPFQGALYGLPPEVIAECILGAIEAQFGTQESNTFNEERKEATLPKSLVATSPVRVKGETGNGHCGNGSLTNGKLHGTNGDKTLEDCCGDGVLESTAELKTQAASVHSASKQVKSNKPRNFEEFIYQVWGAGIAKHFAVPYNRKLWAVPLDEMETSWLGGRVPMPNIREMILGALTPVRKPMGPNARFGYPLKGGFQSLMDGFLPHIKEQLHTGVEVLSVSPLEHSLTLSNGKTVRYEQLVSTMPLPTLIRRMGQAAPTSIQQAVQKLRHVSVRCVHLGISRANISEKHWIYYPEDTVFHRIFLQGNTSPHCNPPGGFGLTCEITYSPHKPLPCEGEDLVQRCIDDCRKVGLIREDDQAAVTAQVDLPYAYVVYDHQRAETVAEIRRWLSHHDIILAGRYSEWEYYNSDHAFIAGKRAADTARDRIRQSPVLSESH